MKRSIILIGLLVSCDTEVEQRQDVQAELVIRYPEMAKCFDMLAQDLISEDTFKTCLEYTSQHTITIDALGNIQEILPDVKASDKLQEGI